MTRLDGRLLVAGPILLVALAAAIAPGLLAPYSPFEIDPGIILAAPSAAHPLGTDEIGRDILSRVIYGARISLGVAFAATAVAGLLGVPLGMAVSYVGGRTENVVMRAIDVFVCLPEIFIALLVVAIFRANLTTLVLTIGLIYFPQFARVAHNVTASIKRQEFVLSARSIGGSNAWIVRSEILPNILPIVIVQASLLLSLAMLLEAALSFLGLGVVPPTPSWGQMVGTLKDYMFNAPWAVLPPALTLFLAVLSINMAGDWLQDALNPGVRH